MQHAVRVVSGLPNSCIGFDRISDELAALDAAYASAFSGVDCSQYRLTSLLLLLPPPRVPATAAA